MADTAAKCLPWCSRSASRLWRGRGLWDSTALFFVLCAVVMLSLAAANNQAAEVVKAVVVPGARAGAVPVPAADDGARGTVVPHHGKLAENATGKTVSQTPANQTKLLSLGHMEAGSGLPGYTILQRVASRRLNVPGGWWPLIMDYKFPEPDPDKYLRQFDEQCYDLALHHTKEDANGSMYKRRHKPPTSLPGGVPRAFFIWEGNITREQFDRVPDHFPARPETQELCPFCMSGFRYQIIDGHLYRKGNASWDDKPYMQMYEDLLLVAVYFWDLPDMDFILHNGDACPPNGYPMLSATICRQNTQAGFTWPPYTIWENALGINQNKAYHQCMLTRHPHKRRRPNVVWRGATTDPIYGGALKINQVHKVARMRLHKMFEDDPVFDTKVYLVTQEDDCVQAYMRPLGNPLPLEKYAEAAIALDIDGHGASFRFGHRFVHLGTPVLKQASNMTVYFEHLMAPGYMVEYYKHDLSDVQVRGYQLVDEWIKAPDRLIKQAEQLQGFAAAFMHQMAVAEAAAYSLLMYSRKLTWKTVRDPSFTHVPFSKVCTTNRNRLPASVCAEFQKQPPRP